MHVARFSVGLLFAAAACGDSDGMDADPPEPGSTALVVAGDFDVTGIASRLHVPSLHMQTNLAAGIAGGDPFLRSDGSRILVINRSSGENVTILNQPDLALIDQIGTGGGSNPQDAVIVGGKLYVAALGSAGILSIDLDDPSAITTIDLSALDQVDGLPDCVSVYPVGTQLVAVCGLLDQFVATAPAKVAVIDTLTDTLVDDFELPWANPYGLIQATPASSVFGGDLVMNLVPDFLDTSGGCLARIQTTPTIAANGCAVDNAELGGYANHYESDGQNLWINVVGYDNGSFEEPFGRVVGVDLATGDLAATALTAPTVLAHDVAACPNGELVVVDGAFGSSGLRVYQGGVEMTAAPLSIGTEPGFGNNLICFDQP